jgi:hypothetical protein
MIGYIESYTPGLRVITAPDTVRVATPFTVTVTTFGSSSCTQPAGATLTVTGLVATITPYDLFSTGGGCTGDIAPRPHPVKLVFGFAGRATIRVRGYTAKDGQRVLSSVDRVLNVVP